MRRHGYDTVEEGSIVNMMKGRERRERVRDRNQMVSSDEYELMSKGQLVIKEITQT